MKFSNLQLLSSFEDACFDFALNPMNKVFENRLRELEQQIAIFLHLSDDELELFRNGPV